MRPRCYFVLALLFFGASQSPAQTTDFSLLDTVFGKIARSYVEKKDASRLMRTGIDATLHSLDPYSSYLTKSEAKEFRTQISGKFGGTGLVIRPVDSLIVVGEVFRGFPADKVGITAGDVILEINGISLHGKSVDQVFPMLRGAPGTTVNLRVQPAGGANSSIKTVVREEVTIGSVPYYGITQNGIGYILLTAETANCSDAVRKALMEIKSRRELKGIILDLRNNPGGLVSEAIKIVNLFVDKGKPAIREMGQLSDTTYYLSQDAADTKTPLILLVNGSTASAAEVISGALQDHDRAVVIGTKTFGKGVVQNLFDLPTGEILKMTVSYYFTPSGRCIQSKSYAARSEGILIPDSMKSVFKTANGRKVIDHDGVSPDVELHEQDQAAVTKELLGNFFSNNLVFQFATEYCTRHPTLGPAASFQLSDQEYDELVKFLTHKNFAYLTRVEGKMSDLKDAALAEGYWEVLSTDFAAMQAKMRSQRENDLLRFKSQIRELVAEEIVSHRYYRWGRIENSLQNDPAVRKAEELFASGDRIAQILGK